MSANKILAAQSFDAIARADSTDLERIIGVVETEVCECLSIEYQGWLDAFQNVASLWAIEHWRLLAQHFAASSGFYECNNDDPARAIEYANSVNLCNARYAALEVALNRVCEIHGLSPDAMRTVAGTEEETAVRSISPPDLDYLRDIMADMERVLNLGTTSLAAH